MQLIRYMSFERGLEAVKTGVFKILRPLDTNDPYEMMGACKGKFSPEVQKTLLEDMRARWDKEYSKYGTRPDFPSLEDAERRVENSNYWFSKVVLDRATQQALHRILCFVDASKITDVADQLMWGHYAHGGRGIRIWFDGDKLDLPYAKVYPVAYRDKRPSIDLSTLKSYIVDDSWSDYLRGVLFSKSKAWGYEFEQRMLVSHRPNEEFIFRKGDLEFVKLPVAAIQRIDFGPKGFIEDTIKAVEELRSMPEFACIAIRVANFSADDYTYEYIPYEECMKKSNQ